MDTISRAAAIDIAMQYCPDDDGSCTKAGVDTREMLDELEDMPSAQPEWIPCSESLPKEDGQYLITEKGTFGDYLYIGIANYGVPCMPMNKGKGRGWFITDSEGDYYCDMNHVLAWMPLPEPYEEAE